jgi:cell wall assembly regulator SMI1
MNFLYGVSYILVLFLLAAGVLWVMDRISNAWWKIKNPPEKLEALHKAVENRLLHPDWEFYEKHLMRSVPEELRILFANHDILKSDFNIEFDDIYITSFEPIDSEGYVDSQKWGVKNIVAFASMDGDQIYLRPGEKENNAVYITYHNGGDTEVLFPDIADFVRRVQASYRNAA